jgi:hypothetical protein
VDPFRPRSSMTTMTPPLLDTLASSTPSKPYTNSSTGPSSTMMYNTLPKVLDHPGDLGFLIKHA